MGKHDSSSRKGKHNSKRRGRKSTTSTIGTNGHESRLLKEKSVSDVNSLLSNVRKLAEKEDDAGESGDKRSWRASTGRSTRASSMASESEDRILKLETLKKQGGRVKSWHTRYFVLRQTGIFYYRDEVAFRANTPLGRIMFCDMITLSDNNKVAEKLFNARDSAN